MSLALPSLHSLHGFLIALVATAPADTDHAKLHKISGMSDYVQCRVLVYQQDDFGDFLARVSPAQTMKMWDEDKHHMVRVSIP